MSKWISIKDELPEDDKLKVVRYSSKGRHIGVALSRRYIPANINTRCWCMEFQTTQGIEITHWASLPKLEEND